MRTPVAASHPLVRAVLALAVVAFVPSRAAAQSRPSPSPAVSQPPVATAASAWPARVTLGDLGFSSGLHLKGASAAMGVGFPLPTAGITGGELTLQIKASPVLAPGSTLRVRSTSASSRRALRPTS